ncbi:hypothetical protein NQ314_008849 [Rhamnusium bicolor]|uniref:Uncharacterized protein n=1 Tax=Rhamnusium bicolor TaxID=1586634 RepID=A0AAV8Y555_9CUCU|nr:hypothetical protein NQ314_008849 [Rhamnusium bicolor]
MNLATWCKFSCTNRKATVSTDLDVNNDDTTPELQDAPECSGVMGPKKKKIKKQISVRPSEKS